MNTPRLLPLALALCTILPSGVALAEDSTTVVGETRYESFEDDLVAGDLVNPNGEILSVRTRGPRRTLIRAREHFVPEILESAENL